MKESKLNNLLEGELKSDLRLSYSKVSDFDRNGAVALIRSKEVDNDGVKHGSLVDILLVDKLTGSNEFDKHFALVDENKPTATLGILANIILTEYTEMPSLEETLNIIKKSELWSNIKKEDTLKDKFNHPDFWNYLKVKFETKNKTVVSAEDKKIALNSVDILINHKFTTNLFKPKENVQHFFQVEFNFEYRNFNFKGFIDFVTINHNTKQVWFRDIKTGQGNGNKFIKSFLEYRYYFQESLYTLSFDSVMKLFNLEGYTLMPFEFIYLGKFEQSPTIFTVTDKWHNSALNGFKTATGYEYRGLNQCLDDIYYHWSTNQYEFTKEIIENNGVLTLNDNFIIENGQI